MALIAQMTPAESGPKRVYSIGDESVTLAQLQAAGYVAPYGDLCIFTTVALTAARTVQLPKISDMIPGAKIELKDLAGGASSTDTLTGTLNGTDQYQGAGTSPKINAANGLLTISTNGTQWNNA